MVAMFLDEKHVGTLPEEDAAQSSRLEFRDDQGRTFHRFVPEPICPREPTATKSNMEQRIADGGGVILAAFWKRMDLAGTVQSQCHSVL